MPSGADECGWREYATAADRKKQGREAMLESRRQEMAKMKRQRARFLHCWLRPRPPRIVS